MPTKQPVVGCIYSVSPHSCCNTNLSRQIESISCIETTPLASYKPEKLSLLFMLRRTSSAEWFIVAYGPQQKLT